MQLIIDIDGTLFDNAHRQHLIPIDPTRTENWVPFNKACKDDSPIEHTMLQVKNFMATARNAHFKSITFLTSRGESARNETVEQLIRYFGLDLFNYAQLIMRPMDVHATPKNFKKDVILRITYNTSAYIPIIMFDDDPSVCRMVREFFPNITLVQVESMCISLQKARGE